MRLRRRVEQSPATVDAVFAGALDGRRLWLAVGARPGGFELRSPDGRAVQVPVEVDDQPGYLSVRLDLAALPTVAASYDVVLVAADGTRAVHGDPASQRVPVAPAGRARHRLERAVDGALRLVTEPLAEAHELHTLTVTDEGVALDLGGAIHHIEGADRAWSRVLVDGLPVRRRDDDLPEPGRSAPLPTVGGLRLRWSGEGLLQARSVEPPEGDG